MSRGKEVISRCVTLIDEVAKIILECEDCIDIFIDYSPLRYPYATLFVILMKCNNLLNRCLPYAYDIILEITIDINSIHKNSIDIEKDVISFRTRCNDAWFEYGYIVPRPSPSAIHATKGFSLLYSGKRIFVESLSRDIIDKLYSVIDFIIRKAKAIMEYEGLI